MRSLLWVVLLAGCITERNRSQDTEDGGAAGEGGQAGAGGQAGEGGGLGGVGGDIDECIFVLEANPASVSFGPVPAFETREITVELTNTGQCPLNIDQILLNGAAGYGLRIDGVDPRRDPEVLEAFFAPGERRALTITFTGREAGGPSAGEVSVFSAAGELKIPLSANEGPCLMLDPPSLSFRAVPLQGVTQTVTVRHCGGAPVTIEGARLRDADEAFALDVNPDELPFPLAEGTSTSIRVVFTPPGPRDYRAILEVLTSDPARPVLSVPLVGRSGENSCPVAEPGFEHIQVELGEVVALDASGSRDVDGPDGRPLRWEWVVLQRPEGSTALPVERFNNPGEPNEGVPDNATTPQALFLPDLMGRYVLELRVTDALDCTDAIQVVIEVGPVIDFEVQLAWEAAVDLDLHLRHPQSRAWSEAPLDCFFRNGNPDWGPVGPDGDPSLLGDAVAGGVEAIRISGAEDTAALAGPYRVGVGRRARDVPVDLTVRVLMGGEVVHAETVRFEGDAGFLEALEIHWPERRIEAPLRFLAEE